MHWNAQLYDQKHNFVAKYGENLLHFLPQAPQQTILDLGCGTGTLTAELQDYGQVTGMDASPDMIAEARQHYPQLNFHVGNGLTLAPTPQYDIIFSNAVFHWIPDHPTLLAHIFQALKPGGQLICEFGGAGNIQTIETGFAQALAQVGGHHQQRFNFPTTDTFGQELTQAGFHVKHLVTFQRPTPLAAGQAGLANWARQFFAPDLADLTATQQDTVFTQLAKNVPELWHEDTWVADYQRLQAVATKP